MNRNDLTDRQREVIEATARPGSRVLVLGGPGTGKTATALWTARSFLESPHASASDRVLFLTFSRTAVSQIAQRAPGILTGVADRIEIFTFHALAYRILHLFGRYAGFGSEIVPIQSDTRRRLLGADTQQLRYDDLVPAALRILEGSSRVRSLLSSRWPLLICDEVQDTSAEQWELTEVLGAQRQLLLGDRHQLIHTFVLGVSEERFAELCRSVDHVIELEAQSHRDPSGAIPALADAVRRRQFQHEAVMDALAAGRLHIITGVESDDYATVLPAEIARARSDHPRSVGIFGHSNAGVAELARALHAHGIEHVLIGIPEAHAEALAAMNTLCAFAVGLATESDLHTGLALFITSATRGQKVPPLALAFRGLRALPAGLTDLIDRLKLDLVDAGRGPLGELVQVAADAWRRLRISPGTAPWTRAAAHFVALARPLATQPASEASVQQLQLVVERSRVESMLDLDWAQAGLVSLMNFHQTKGREADVVLLVYQPNDYLAHRAAREPYTDASRLLYVAMTRARERVVVVLSPQPHVLVAPFADLAASGGQDSR